MDYKTLLLKYINHVGISEGTTFLGDPDRIGWLDSVVFTDEEWAELQRLDAIKYEPKPTTPKRDERWENVIAHVSVAELETPIHPLVPLESKEIVEFNISIPYGKTVYNFTQYQPKSKIDSSNIDVYSLTLDFMVESMDDVLKEESSPELNEDEMQLALKLSDAGPTKEEAIRWVKNVVIQAEKRGSRSQEESSP